MRWRDDSDTDGTDVGDVQLLCCCDQKFIKLAAAMLKSVEVHLGGAGLTVHFMDLGILKCAKQQLTRSLGQSKVTVRWYKTRKSSLRKLDPKLAIMRSPPYGRLVFPEVLPAGIRKLIYLDVDLIVLSSLRDLYTKDLAGNTIAAAKDRAGTVDCSWAGIPNYEALGIPGKTPYFNSGVMLIDVARWRADRVSERVLDVTRQNREHVRWHDQYGLNVVLRGAWEELDPSWNHFDGILPSTRVFHYLSSKPIFHDYKGAHGDLFFRYLDQTAWAGWRPRREPRQFRLLKERIVRKVLIPLGF